MIDLDEIIRQMTANAQAIRALLENISTEQAAWKPDPQTWSMNQVMEHVYNEERIDFRQHIREMFKNPPMEWGTLKEASWLQVVDCQQSLEGFLKEREASIGWLQSLDKPDWEVSSTAQFGPSEVLTLSAADVLVSWVAHDHLHLRQMNELLYAWNEHQAAPHSVQYAGGW
jgi:hypothetical protein